MCEFCGSTDGCKPTDGLITVYPLTKDDWQDLYQFMKYSYLPFVHSIIIRAQKQAGVEYKNGRGRRKLNPKVKEREG